MQRSCSGRESREGLEEGRTREGNPSGRSQPSGKGIHLYSNNWELISGDKCKLGASFGVHSSTTLRGWTQLSYVQGFWSEGWHFVYNKYVKGILFGTGVSNIAVAWNFFLKAGHRSSVLTHDCAFKPHFLPILFLWICLLHKIYF